MTPIQKEYEKRRKQILKKSSTDQGDYTQLWNVCINYFDGDMESFGEPDLASIIQCLDKFNGKPSAVLFANSWAESILLNKDFIPFVKKFEEKILFPASNLTGDIKRQEHITIIFSNAAHINSNVMMHVLVKLKDKKFKDDFYSDEDIYKNFQFSIIEFLQGINKGTSEQKFQCLLSIDKLMDEYSETKVALSNLVGFKDPVSFMDIVEKTLKDCKQEQLSHIQDIVKVVCTYAMSNELKNELADKSQTTNKKFKV